MITIKTENEIKIMKEGGKIAARILKIVARNVRPGIKTKFLDDIAKEEIKKEGVKASFFGHGGYPASICTSVNSEVVHGIPGEKILNEGDIVGIDLGIFHKGYHSDTAITVPVGKINFEKKELIKITKKSLDDGIAIIKPGIFLGDVQHRIQSIIESAGFNVIRDLAGHGIGKNLQEMPSIPNYGRPKNGPILKKGMVLALEPMVVTGNWHVKILNDRWTVATVDGSMSAHFEHTVAVREDGYEVLTRI